jgi:hypothetical protein
MPECHVWKKLSKPVASMLNDLPVAGFNYWDIIFNGKTMIDNSNLKGLIQLVQETENFDHNQTQLLLI